MMAWAIFWWETLLVDYVFLNIQQSFLKICLIKYLLFSQTKRLTHHLFKKSTIHKHLTQFNDTYFNFHQLIVNNTTVPSQTNCKKKKKDETFFKSIFQ